MASVTKATLLKLAKQGKLRLGHTRFSLSEPSRHNPRIALMFGQSNVGFVPYHDEYLTDTDKAILAAIAKEQGTWLQSVT